MNVSQTKQKTSKVQLLKFFPSSSEMKKLFLLTEKKLNEK